ncbi:MAG: tRNA 2-thiouridine(34) synthase MnmA, partial [Clostridia bacterium]
AMSGGVDSSVAAYILTEKGYAASGITMKLFDFADECSDSLCCSTDDAADAENVAKQLDIPFYIANLKDEFVSRVITPFVNSYLNGQTPNPCIECNRHLKFDKLFKKADDLNIKYLATGHYADIEFSNGKYLLKKSKNLQKDQSYVLYSLNQQKLSRLIFPLGSLSKEEVREIAKKCGFFNYNKPDSQDICFIKNGDYVDFISHFLGVNFSKGKFLNSDGKVIGEHNGMIYYTIGQRRGLGTGFGERIYVTSKNATDNTVTLGKDEDLFKKSFIVKNANFIPFDILSSPLKLSAKIRYRMVEQPATVFPESANSVRVEFDFPQRAISPGQSAVFYDGEYVVGGGEIV